MASKIAEISCPICKERKYREIFEVKDRRSSQETFAVGDCQECGFRITLQAPGEEIISRYYESDDYISHSDSEDSLINKLYHRVRDVMLKRKQKIIEKYHRQKGTLLDFGSGTGYFLHAMKQSGWQVRGMEVDPTSRELSRKRFGLEVEQPNLEAIGSEAFDVITLWHVLEHVHELHGTLEALKTGLRPDGTLVFALPNSSSYDAKYYKSYWDAYDVPRHLWHFTPESLEKLLSQHQLEIVETREMPFDVFYIAIRSEQYKNAPLGFLQAGIKAVTWKLRSFFQPERGSALMYIIKRTD